MTPHRLMLSARFGLVFSAVGLAILMLGPFAGLEKTFLLGDKEAHALAFYIAANLTFLAFPKVRRNDLALILVTLGALVEAGQSFTGRDAELGDWIADVIGVAAATLPVLIEQMRGLARDYPWLSLMDAWQRYDRRGKKAAVARPATAGLSGRYLAGARSMTRG